MITDSYSDVGTFNGSPDLMIFSILRRTEVELCAYAKEWNTYYIVSILVAVAHYGPRVVGLDKIKYGYAPHNISLRDKTVGSTV